MGTWALLKACQDFEEEGRVESMESQRGLGICHIPSRNDRRAGPREALVGPL